MAHDVQHIPLWRRALAYWWYVWGLSICYRANRMVDRETYAVGVRSFVRAAHIWPTFAGAYYQAGLIRGRELGEYTEALDDLSRAIALEPEWPAPYLQRAIFQRFHNAPGAALADFQRFVALADNGYWKQEAQRQIDTLLAERTGNDGDSDIH